MNNETVPTVTSTLTQVTGNTEITPPIFAKYYQITIVPSSGATGTVALSFQSYDDGSVTSNFEPILNPDTGTQEIINLASPRSIAFRGLVNKFRVEPTSVVGSYKVIIRGARGL